MGLKSFFGILQILKSLLEQIIQKPPEYYSWKHSLYDQIRYLNFLIGLISQGVRTLDSIYYKKSEIELKYLKDLYHIVVDRIDNFSALFTVIYKCGINWSL